MINLEEAVIRKIKTAQHVLCTVESCTGGLISNLVTNVPGASEIYWGSFITYDNSAKENLGVSRKSLSNHGAVSVAVARELAECGLGTMQDILAKTPSNSLIRPKGFVCLATTGIAGPSGGSREKPVGLCFIGLAISGQQTLVEEFFAPQSLSRVQIKTQFAQRALELVRGSF